ncbi:MAG: metallophosphoesterase [Flavobacterium sp.]
MNKIIIHISDLHVSLHENLKGVPKKVNSWLTTNNINKDSDFFISEFIRFINKNYEKNEKYFLITGDITNEADILEFEFGLKFINKIVSELKLNKDNVFLIPGDHDVNRRMCEDAFRNGKISGDSREPFEYFEEKFKNFDSFYFSFFNKSFSFNDSIIDSKIIDSKIMLIGINSNYKIDYEGGEGFIDTVKFDKELIELMKVHNKIVKIAIFHHNIISNFENKNDGQWNSDNRKHIISLLEKFDIKCVLNGNEHTRGSDYLTPNIIVSDSGSFTTKNEQASFKCYEILNNENHIKFVQKIYTIQKRSGNDDLKPGYWGTQNPEEIKEINEFDLWSKGDEKIVNQDISLDLEISAVPIIKKTTKTTTQLILKKKYNISYYADELYKIIKRNKLFHSGHFHWSKTSRAHNWIDVSKILENNEHLLLAKKSIVDVVEKCELIDKFDFVIGLGTEGNIISTRTVIKYNKPYSFLPYSYRYDEHNEFEQKLNFVNNGSYKNILIITDVVNDGRTIRKLIGKREELFFKDVENIYVISLFYTGDEKEIHSGILNHSNIKKFDSENDEIINNIEFYSVLNIKVEKCPYGKEFESECLIYKDGLDCVHLFYDEKKI